ncbi:MAG TPA: MFS transporter [bacterium]|nr:MFS transporter [bacterium]
MDAVDRAAPVRAAWRVLALATLQQAGLTSIRFGLPILAPFLRDALRLSLAQVGVLLGAFDLGALILFIPLGVLADRWGEPVVLAGGALFTAAVTAVAATAHGFWPLAFLLAVAGLGYGSGQTAGNQVVSEVFTAAGRGTAMGVRQSGLPIGGLFAAMVVPPLATALGWPAAVGVVAIACAVPGVLCWVGLRVVARPGAAVPPVRALVALVWEIIRTPGVWRMTWVAMLLVISQFCYQDYLAFYLVDRFGWSKHVAAGLLIAVNLGGVFGRLAWGALSDRRYGGRRVPALAWCVGAGAVFPVLLLALPASPARLPEVAAVALVGGALLLGWNGLYSTLITELAGRNLGATAMGVSMTALFVATILSPPLFGWLVDATSYAVGWVVLIGVMGLALIGARGIPEPGR